ncbi:MAG: glycoside hydrolase family 3 C-terminal domain-containing protein, partial [Lachnospiraceae bacterium]|nr:glycoside hydrolase family 3 C-terminal domain-containing protein [Lachnospiraceae bacterium]
GLVKEGAIEKACYHLMRTRVRLGCFEEKEPFDRIPYTCVSSEAHKKLSLECARRSMVLLENNGILPLDEKSYKTIAVIGPNATSLECLNGNYNGTADKYVTFLDGIRERFRGRVLYALGSHLYKDRTSVLAKPGDTYAEAIVCAKNSDLVILCLGLDPTIEGEEGDTGNEFSSGDKECLKLPESQRHLLSKVMALGKPVVVLVAAGSAINTLSHPDALIHAWYPGSEGGTALAEILFGDVSPSGKLPVTFYENDEDLPDFTDYSMQGRTYRYTRENILYPFGYGLTYGKVIISSASYENDVVNIRVRNAGTVKTEDVIELYIKGNAPEEKEIIRLCGFKRIKLSAGEEKDVMIPLPAGSRAFTCCNAKGERAVYSDRFTLYVGTHQPDHISTRLSNTQTVRIEISI